MFHNPGYVDMFRLLVDSIARYGCRTATPTLLVYTSSAFRPAVLAAVPPSLPVLVTVCDDYQTVEQACRARLALFHLPHVDQFDRILYLDTDILCVGDLAPVFALCTQERIYALEEGDMRTHDPRWDYYGKTLFDKDDLPRIEHRTAFSSGIMLFPNTPTLRRLFHDMADDCVRRPICKFDQPYIVHHAMKHDMADNQRMIPYAILYNDYVKKGVLLPPTMTLIHFAGGVGVHAHKLRNMIAFIDSLS